MNDTDTLGALTSLLGGKAGWLPAAVAWMGSARIVAKLFSTQLQGGLDAALKFFAESDSERAAIERFLQRRSYRVVAFFVDYVLSVKLPQVPAVAKAKPVPAPVPLILAALIPLAVGCASQKTILTEAIHADGSSTKETKVYTRTFFDSKTALAKLKTSSTDKTQSVGISDLAMEASGTNAVDMTERIVRAAVGAAVTR